MKNAVEAFYFSSTVFKLNAASGTMLWNQNIFLHPSCTECQSNSDHKGESFHVYIHRDKSATLKISLFPVHVIFANIHFMGGADFPMPFLSVPTHRTENARSAENIFS